MAASSSSSSLAAKLVKLKSSDGEMFEVDEAVAFESQTLKNMVEDMGSGAPIPLPNVSSKILAKMIEYCKYHSDIGQKAGNDKPAEDEVRAWDKDFIEVDQVILYDLMTAANYLNIKNLYELTIHTVADMMVGMKPEQVRKTFNIKNDFTREEEEVLKKEDQWTFK